MHFGPMLKVTLIKPAIVPSRQSILKSKKTHQTTVIDI